MRAPILAFAVAAFAATPAAAHHGWSWAEEQQTELTGTIREIYIGAPHPVLTVAAADGQTWTIELGNPNQTARSGFKEGSAKIGDEVTALGNRARGTGEKRMKAVRITIGGKNFDLYPERIGRTD
jgi:hypothetical protein